MSEYVIRSDQAQIDPQALAQLGRDTFIDAFGNLYSSANLNAFLDEKHTASAYKALLSDPLFHFVCAYDDADMIGYLLTGPCNLPVDDPQPSDGEVIRFYVREGHQGAGLGRKMMDEGMAYLTANFDSIYLSVYSDNKNAQRFYKRYGFEIVKEYEFMVGDHADPEFIMRRG